MSRSLEQDVDFFLVDGPGYTEVEAYALLAGLGRNTSTLPPLTAAAFWKSADHPRDDSNGRFTDKNSEFNDRLAKAATGRKALGAAKNVNELSKSDPVRRSAAEYYMATGATEYNARLRAGATLAHVELVATDRLDAMMSESTLNRDVVVHRGIRDPRTVFGDNWREDSANDGLMWRDNAYVSTTVDSDVSNWHAKKSGGNPVIMRILLPVGTRAVHLDNALADSSQLLLPRGTQFRVVADHMRDKKGVRRIDVEVLS